MPSQHLAVVCRASDAYQITGSQANRSHEPHASHAAIYFTLYRLIARLKHWSTSTTKLILCLSVLPDLPTSYLVQICGSTTWPIFESFGRPLANVLCTPACAGSVPVSERPRLRMQAFQSSPLWTQVGEHLYTLTDLTMQGYSHR